MLTTTACLFPHAVLQLVSRVDISKGTRVIKYAGIRRWLYGDNTSESQYIARLPT